MNNDFIFLTDNCFPDKLKDKYLYPRIFGKQLISTTHLNDNQLIIKSTIKSYDDQEIVPSNTNIDDCCYVNKFRIGKHNIEKELVREFIQDNTYIPGLQVSNLYPIEYKYILRSRIFELKYKLDKEYLTILQEEEKWFYNKYKFIIQNEFNNNLEDLCTIKFIIDKYKQPKYDFHIACMNINGNWDYYKFDEIFFRNCCKGIINLDQYVFLGMYY